MLAVVFWLVAPPPAVDYPALQQRLLRGNYAEARSGYEAVLKEPNPAPAAFAGLAEVHRAVGEYDAALDVLAAGLKAHPGQPDLLARRADLLWSLGRWDEAAADVAAVLSKHDGHLLARWVRARLARDRGDRAAAEQDVRYLVRAYTEASFADRDITDAEALVVIGQAGAENARWNNKPQQFAFIVNEVCGDALKANPDYWPAEVLAGRLLMEKHNRADAADAFDKALKINPRAVEALVGKGELALAELDTAAADRAAELALKVNPRHPGALRLRAGVRLAEGDPAGAERLLLAAKLVNPRDEATLARLAAIYHLTRRPDQEAQVEREVAGFCSKPGVFYLELAEVLTARKQYARAEQCYRRAAELRPDLAAARAGLGLLYLQLGREPEARVHLEAAFKADPFHVRVSNALKVLRHLDGYATRTTEHFVIRYDPQTDAVLAAFLADALERWHAEYAHRYGFAPPGKLLVEVFSSREMFSGRVLTLPGLPGAAQGASTGPLIALPSPRTARRPYNWAVVARHELTHAFNLIQTDYRVPIWLTEGLAVRAENTRRFDDALPLLRDRLAEGTVFDLESIGRGYHNFAQPADVTLAYLQGWLYVEYLVRTYGEGAVGRLLDAFRQGLTVGDALRRACDVDAAAFERGYRAFLHEQVKSLPRAEKPVPFAELEATHRKDPADPDVAARLAAEYARRNRPADARRLAEAVLARDPGHPAAALVLARLRQREKDVAGATAVLEAAARAHPDDPRLLAALARLYLEADAPEPALAALEKLRARGPVDPDVLETLARLYAGRPDAVRQRVEVLTELAARRPDDLAVRLELARVSGDPVRWATEALYVDVTHPEAKMLLLDGLRAAGRTAEADAIEQRYR